MAYSIYCILIYTLLLCACFFAAILIASRVERLLRQREREAHREQAQADMQAMKETYQWMIMNEIKKGIYTDV